MPDAARNHESLSWSELDLPRRLAVLEYDRHLAGDEEEQFVTVGVHLTAVGWVAGHHRGAHREPVDASGRTGVTRDQFGIARSIKTNRACCQIDAAVILIGQYGLRLGVRILQETRNANIPVSSGGGPLRLEHLVVYGKRQARHAPKKSKVKLGKRRKLQ